MSNKFELDLTITESGIISPMQDVPEGPGGGCVSGDPCGIACCYLCCSDGDDDNKN